MFFRNFCTLFCRVTDVLTVVAVATVSISASVTESWGDDCWYPMFRIKPGINRSAYEAYVNATDVHPSCQTLQDSEDCRKQSSHFRSPLLDLWSQLSIDKVRISLQNDSGKEVQYFQFNGTGADFAQWFSMERLLNSSYNDLSVISHGHQTDQWPQYFSINGTGDTTGRMRFLISHNDSDCALVKGWLGLVDAIDTNCSWTQYPIIVYSTLQNYSWWEADISASLLGNSCMTACDCDVSMTCSRHFTCACEAGYLPNTDRKCGRTVGSKCHNDSDCASQTNMTCQTAPHSGNLTEPAVCHCQPGYVAMATGHCARAWGQDCNTTADCGSAMNCVVRTNTSSDSSDRHCQCRGSFAARSDGSCGLAVDQNCTTTGDCGANMTCVPANTTCQCDLGFVPKSDGTCGKVNRQICQHDADCGDRMRCETRPQLPPGYTTSVLSHCVCANGTVDMLDGGCGNGQGTACKDSRTCGNYMTCNNTSLLNPDRSPVFTCRCQDGFTPRGLYCGLAYGKACNSSEQCGDKMVCHSLTFLCVCGEGAQSVGSPSCVGERNLTAELNMTMSDLKDALNEGTKKNLSVAVTDLSSVKTKKISASDHRSSSLYVGYVAMTLIALALGLVVTMDLLSLCRWWEARGGRKRAVKIAPVPSPDTVQAETCTDYDPEDQEEETWSESDLEEVKTYPDPYPEQVEAYPDPYPEEVESYPDLYPQEVETYLDPFPEEVETYTDPNTVETETCPDSYPEEAKPSTDLNPRQAETYPDPDPGERKARLGQAKKRGVARRPRHGPARGRAAPRLHQKAWLFICWT